MKDNIIFQKLWQDSELMQIEVLFSSSVAIAKAKIYVSNTLLDELISQINQFLDGHTKECQWTNEDRGDDTTACVSLRVMKKDKLGHVLVEVFAELDDGGDYSKHNCCFYINTEVGLLEKFCRGVVHLKGSAVGFKIRLNEDR